MVKGDVEEEIRRCYFRLSFTTWKCVNSVCFKMTDGKYLPADNEAK